MKFETTPRDARAKAVEIETNLIKCKLWIYKLTGVDAQRRALLSNLSECMFWRLSSARLITNQSFTVINRRRLPVTQTLLRRCRA